MNKTTYRTALLLGILGMILIEVAFNEMINETKQTITISIGALMIIICVAMFMLCDKPKQEGNEFVKRD